VTDYDDRPWERPVGIIAVPTVRTGRRAHLILEYGEHRWNRTLCNVTISDDWRDLTRNERETLSLCPNCVHRWQWWLDLGEWIAELPDAAPTSRGPVS